MTKQPEALRLADALEDDLIGYDGLSLPGFCQNIADEAAAELRRLHKIVELARQVAQEDLTYINKLEVQNQELLQALQIIAGESPCIDNLMSDKDIARATITKVTGEQQ